MGRGLGHWVRLSRADVTVYISAEVGYSWGKLLARANADSIAQVVSEDQSYR
jgi:hypothetical protein